MSTLSFWYNKIMTDKIIGTYAVPCYVFRQLGRVRWIEFHIEGEIIVGTLREKKVDVMK